MFTAMLVAFPRNPSFLTAQHAGRLRGDSGTMSYPLKGDEFKALCGRGLQTQNPEWERSQRWVSACQPALTQNPATSFFSTYGPIRLEMGSSLISLVPLKESRENSGFRILL